MPHGEPFEDALEPTHELAAGPGPSPRGVDDGAPQPGAEPPGGAQEDVERDAAGGAARPKDTQVGGSEPDVAPEAPREAGTEGEGPAR